MSERASGSGTAVPTSLFTDHYELTMVAAALADGAADRRCTFEVFARRLPEGRRYGVVAGTARLLDAITRFRFGEAELERADPAPGVGEPARPRRLELGGAG